LLAPVTTVVQTFVAPVFIGVQQLLAPVFIGVQTLEALVLTTDQVEFIFVVIVWLLLLT
jgi:hypothetical protein